MDSNQKSPCRDCPVHLEKGSKLARVKEEDRYYFTIGIQTPRLTGRLIDQCHNCEKRDAFYSLDGMPTNGRPVHILNRAAINAVRARVIS